MTTILDNRHFAATKLLAWEHGVTIAENTILTSDRVNLITQGRLADSDVVDPYRNSLRLTPEEVFEKVTGKEGHTYNQWEMPDVLHDMYELWEDTVRDAYWDELITRTFEHTAERSRAGSNHRRRRIIDLLTAASTE